MRLHISENVIRAEFADISQMRRRPTRVGSPAQPGGEMPAAHKGQRNHQPKPPTHNHQPTTTNPQPPTHNHLAHSLRCTPSGQHTLKMLWHSAVFTLGSRGVRCPTLRNLRVPQRRATFAAATATRKWNSAATHSATHVQRWQTLPDGVVHTRTFLSNLRFSIFKSGWVSMNCNDRMRLGRVGWEE